VLAPLFVLFIFQLLQLPGGNFHFQSQSSPGTATKVFEKFLTRFSETEFRDSSDFSGAEK
jgi:hypothetical protein